MNVFAFKTRDNYNLITVDTKTGIVDTNGNEGVRDFPDISFPLLDPPAHNSYRAYTLIYNSVKPEFRARFMRQIERWQNHFIQITYPDTFEGWLYWLENTNPATIIETQTLNDTMCGIHYFQKCGFFSGYLGAIWRAFMLARQLPDYERIAPICALLRRENTISKLHLDFWETYFYEKLRHNDDFAEVRNMWDDIVKVMEQIWRDNREI